MTAHDIAAAVRAGRLRATDVAERAIAAIRARDGGIGAVTRLLADRARAEAARVDAIVAAGGDPGPLAGVPYGVKDLFDVAGLPTTAGAATRADAPPATADADAIAAFAAAGAVLVATLNMDEFAYGFATVNAHHGTTRNPHDPARLAGGSSGGSAAAVAAGMLPLTLGSDTNGSIRIPAALCGVYGLKPSHGALPMAGIYPFADSFDDIGPLTANIADLRLASEVLRGAAYPAAHVTPRIARLGGWFADNVEPDMAAALDALARALGASETVTLAEVGAARSAAFVITASEGGRFHLPGLRTAAMGYDPATRDRLIAGAMLTDEEVAPARRFHTWFAEQAAALFGAWDVLLAPATPGVAPMIDDPTITVDGARVPARANLGLYTQPLSFIGLPTLVVPVEGASGLPLGIQLVGAPGAEPMLFALAERLERDGLCGAAPPPA